ncbi:hypothetical protein BHM03_00040543 [Ensete ventricosum]|nr:hypothetical protein BHM03_00040543 [Ensete ventricosum]
MITDATGVSKVIMEVAKSSSMRRTGVTALLWYVMRGAPLRLHSKAETVWHLLIDKSIFSLGHKYPEGKGRSKNGGGEENWCFGGMWLRRERGSRTVRIRYRQKMLDLHLAAVCSCIQVEKFKLHFWFAWIPEIAESRSRQLIPLFFKFLGYSGDDCFSWSVLCDACSQHTGVSHRRAVLCFLAQLEVKELQLFFSLLLKPLIPRRLTNELFDSSNDEPSEGLIGGSQASILIKCSTSIEVANVSWKKKNGFVHVIEEILRTFDESRIKPYLNPLMMIVVRILENCMLNLASENRNRAVNIAVSLSANLPDHEMSTAATDSILV